MYELTGYIYSVIAGIAAIFFIWQAMEKKSEPLFLAGLAFVIVSWSGLEWSLWLYGKNMFTMVFAPIIPLLSYFVVWSLAIIYLSETQFKRRDWIAFLALVIIIIWIASFCMNCLFEPGV